MTYLIILSDKERKLPKQDPRSQQVGDRQIVAFSHKDLIEILSLLDADRFEVLTVKPAGNLENGKEFKKELLEESRPDDLNIDLKEEEEEE